MNQAEVINHIKETASRILPANATLWLFGSRARGDAHPDSDYDLLILLDKDHITYDDYDKYTYPLSELGIDVEAEINPHIYANKDWESWTLMPFHRNVEHDNIVLI